MGNRSSKQGTANDTAFQTAAYENHRIYRHRRVCRSAALVRSQSVGTSSPEPVQVEVLCECVGESYVEDAESRVVQPGALDCESSMEFSSATEALTGTNESFSSTPNLQHPALDQTSEVFGEVGASVERRR
jgi:hypothetical protein